MNTFPVFPKLQTFIAQRFGLEQDEVTPLCRLGEDFATDPIEAAEFLIAVEDEWAIKIPDAEAEKLQTVQQLQAYIEQNAPPSAEETVTKLLSRLRVSAPA
jgi:acyl carrier protein